MLIGAPFRCWVPTTHHLIKTPPLQIFLLQWLLVLQKNLYSNLEEHILFISFIFKLCSSYCFIDSFLQYYSLGSTFLSLLLLEIVCRCRIIIIIWKPAPCLLTGGLWVPFFGDCWDVSIMDFQCKLLYCWQQNDHSKHPNLPYEKSQW